MVYFHFYSIECIFKISLEISSTHGLFRSVLFSFQLFGDFPAVFLLLTSFWFHSGRRTHLYNFISLNMVSLLFWPRIYNLSSYMFHGHLKKKGYSALGCSILQILIGSCWLMLVSNSSIYISSVLCYKLLRERYWGLHIQL